MSPNIRFALCTFAFVIYLYLDRSLSLEKKTLEKPEGSLKNGQFRETGNIEYTRRKTHVKFLN
jgi:hypothetical protein